MYDLITPAAMLRELCIDRVDSLDSEFCFVGDMPDEPNFNVCLYDYGGDPQNDFLALDNYKVQIRSRGSYTQGYQILDNIRKEVQSIPEVLLNDGSRIVGIWILTPVTMIGRDERDRSLFSLNLKIVISPSNPGFRG